MAIARPAPRPVLSSPEAEEQVLGAILIAGDYCMPHLTWLKPEDFFDDRNRRIFEAMKKLPVDGITWVAVSHALGNERAYLHHLLSIVLDYVFVEPHARIVKDFSERRRAIQQAGEMAKVAYAGGLPKARHGVQI